MYKGFLLARHVLKLRYDFTALKIRCSYIYATLNDGDTVWEMRRWVISSLCERHIVYLHKPR